MWPVRVVTWLAWVTTWLVWVTTRPFGMQPSSAQELPCQVPVVGRSVWSLLLLVPLRSRLVFVQGGGCGGRLRRRSPR